MSDKPHNIAGKDSENPIIIDGDDKNQPVSQSKTGSKHSTQEKEEGCILIDDEHEENNIVFEKKNQPQCQVTNDCNHPTDISKDLSFKIVCLEEGILGKGINSTDRSGLPSFLFDNTSALVETDNKIKRKNVSSSQIEIQKNANDNIIDLSDLYSEPFNLCLSEMEKDSSKDEINYLMKDETFIRNLNRELNGFLNTIILD